MEPEDKESHDRGDELDFLDEKKDEGVEGKKEAAKDDDKSGDEDKEKEKERKQEHRIPKQRLDQEIAKRRAAEESAARRIEELEKQIVRQRESADVRRLESRVGQLDAALEKAMDEGDTKEARAIRAEIRATERLINRAEAAQQSIEAKQQAVAEVRYDLVLSRIEFEYPQINPDSDEFEASKAEECFELIEAFKSKGASPDQALARAVRYVLGPPRSALQVAEQELGKDGLRRAAADPKEERALEARKKIADATRRQPPAGRGVGVDSDRLGDHKKLTADEIARMSQKQFAKLDEDTLKALRGDEV